MLTLQRKTLTVRDLAFEDLRACVDLFVETFSLPPWDEPWPPAKSRAYLQDIHCTPGGRGVVAWDGGVCVGFAIGQVEHWCEGLSFCLREMCVKPSRQRSGVGTAIVRGLQRRLAADAVGTIYLMTVRDGVAQAFYKKMGFATSPRKVVMTSRIASPRGILHD